MNIPLANRLKKRAQRDVALFQDVLVRIIYEVDSTIEIHGDTAIWRCFNGRRFSKDIDIYVSSQVGWDTFKEKIRATADKYGAKVIKLKDAGDLIFMELLLDDIHSEIDINYKKYYKTPVIKQYRNIDGSVYDVLTLPPEILIEEKIDAYRGRQYITDLYDINILMDSAEISIVKAGLKNFIMSIETPKNIKIQEATLHDLIYEGPVPSFSSLVSSIKGRIL